MQITKKFIEDNYRRYLKKAYRNFPNVLNSVEETIDELDDEDWENVVNFFSDLKFPLKVFRGLEVKSREDINLKNPGIHWTIDTKLFKVKNSTIKNSNYILVGEVEENQVDWVNTISTYMYYSLRPSYGFYPENEITLKKGQIPNNLTIIAKEDLKESLSNNLTKAKELLKPYITNHFSTGSYYIDENGTIYDLGNSGYGHAEVSELLNNNGLEIDYKIGKSSRFLKSAGWIRLNTNLNFIELPEKRITEEQKKQLIPALDVMFNNVKMDREVQIIAGKQKTTYTDCLPKYVIKRIERYYTSGTLYEYCWEESDPWDSTIKESETVPELLGKDFLYHATYKPYWEEIKKEGL